MNEKVGGECVISKRWDAEPSEGSKATGQNKSRNIKKRKKNLPRFLKTKQNKKVKGEKVANG